MSSAWPNLQRSDLEEEWMNVLCDMDYLIELARPMFTTNQNMKVGSVRNKIVSLAARHIDTDKEATQRRQALGLRTDVAMPQLIPTRHVRPDDSDDSDDPPGLVASASSHDSMPDIFGRGTPRSSDESDSHLHGPSQPSRITVKPSTRQQRRMRQQANKAAKKRK